MAKLSFINASDKAFESNIKITTIAKGVFFSFIVTILFFAVFALLITYANFPETYTYGVVVITTILSVLTGGIVVTKKAKSRGWFFGALSGISYMAILYILNGLVFSEFSFDMYMLTMFFIGFFTGALGGIVGINLKKKKK